MVFFRLKLSRVNGFLLIALLVSSIIFVFLPSSSVVAESWTASPQGSFLSPKWVGHVAGGGEAIVTADVIASIPGEEVFHAGGPAQPSSTPGRVTCLNGRTSDEIWRKTIYGVGDTASLQMADVEGDGKLEIVVALQAPAGLYILNAEDGSVLWRAPGNFTFNGTDIGGFILPVGGRVDGSGVIGDIDGDGYPTVFLGVMAYEEQPESGKLIAWEWNPAQGTMVEQARTTVWHPCAGGLSLGDTDNDGTFELYMNERDAYYGDGSWGRGLTSFWAENLTLRWRIYDWGASSNIPMLADVNKDGITDVVSTNLGTGICVLNSTDGRPLTGAGGVVLYNQQLGLPVHYQSTIYDIDNDGNLELMCADGTHVATGMGFISNYTMIWDLYNWRLDGIIDAGLAFRGPSVGEVTGDGLMDIIVATYDESGNNSDTIKIYNQTYNLVDQFVGLRRPAIGSVVQDIDRDDGGLNELLVLTQGGIIYCFDTPGIASNPRARSEVHFYSESRNGASEYIPFERPWPDVSSPSIAPGAVNVSTTLNQLSFRLNHPLGQKMNYTITTTPNVGSGGETNVTNGVRSINVSRLAASTTYRWQVNATDQSGHKTSKNYWFITAPYFSNSAPTQGNPILNSTNGGNSITEDLTCYNQSTADVNGNGVTNVYNWLKNGVSLANLNLPFESKPDADAVYSGYAVANDYSGIGNDGTVFGATWTKGVVGGGFSFDGNDFIRIEEQNSSLGGDGSWSQIAVECWIKATTTMSNKPVIGKTDRYTTGTVGYRLDCSANLTSSRLSFTWYIYTLTNAYNVTYTLTSGSSDWHHVVCTYKSGVGLKIYVDGAERINSGPTIAGNINATDGPLEIAFNSGLDFSTVVDYQSYLDAQKDFTGLLDEVKVYPSAVSASFVNQRYLETKDGLSSKSTIPHNDLSVNDRWTCQITPNDASTDGTTKTANVVKVATPIVFADGFEAGDFRAWTGVTNTTGGSANVTLSQPHSGSYSAQFSINSGNGTRRAYCYTNLTDISELYASAYVYVADGLPLANGQSMWLIQLTNSSDATVGSFGLKADASGTWWAVQYSNWPYVLGASGPSEGNWYLVEAYYKNTDSGKTLIISVDGVEMASLIQDTKSSNDVTLTRFGIGYYSGTSAASVFIDDTSVNNGQSPIQKEKECLVVRGTDNLLYYRVFDGSTWSPNWNMIPGETMYEPAAAVLNGKLHVAIVGPMYNAIYWGSVDLETGEFSGWTWIEGASDSTPALAASENGLCLVVRGTDSNLYYRTYDNIAWSGWQIIPGQTNYEPAAAIFNGKLQVAIVGPMYNALFWGNVNLTTGEFSGWTWIEGASDSTPALAASDNALGLIVRGTDNALYYRVSDGTTWSPNWNMIPGETLYEPAAVGSGNNLDLAIVGTMYNAIYWGSVNVDSGGFSGWTWIPGGSDSTPALA